MPKKGQTKTDTSRAENKTTSSRSAQEKMEYFTIRSVKEIQGRTADRLIIIGDREAITKDFREKPQFEIRLGENPSIDESALKLKVGDIVGTTVDQYSISITRPDQTKTNQIIFVPKSPFIPIKKLAIEGTLIQDPKIAKTGKGEIGVIQINELTENTKSVSNFKSGRNIVISEKYIDSIRKLKTGDRISVTTHPKTYFNTETRSNDIIWQALEEVQKLRKSRTPSKRQERGI
ncbi:MAG: hypothetical protein RLO17_24765 [Cyclobacteriaceae bacterium]|jgi:hypothetical protein|tara:strand:+ start:4147 stop:4845 length:699 start_codon:yes stop_codon:yes gene_type:complete